MKSWKYTRFVCKFYEFHVNFFADSGMTGQRCRSSFFTFGKQQQQQFNEKYVSFAATYS